MPAIPHISGDNACEGLRMTADEFMALGETEQRMELIDGIVVVAPRAEPLHQRLGLVLLRQLEDSIPAGGDLYYQTDLVLSSQLVFCPDVVVYRPGRMGRVPDRLDIAPDLVVEVLSPQNRKKDLLTKRHDYETHGVGEYWIVDPVDMSVLLLKRREGHFVESRITDGSFGCDSIPGVRADWSTLKSAFK